MGALMPVLEVQLMDRMECVMEHLRLWYLISIVSEFQLCYVDYIVK